MFMNSTNKTTTLYCYQEKLTSGETTNTHGIIFNNPAQTSSGILQEEHATKINAACACWHPNEIRTGEILSLALEA